jgi:hypothetical protein
MDVPLYTIRDHLVMIDRDVAQLFGTSTRTLNQQVTRNDSRFERFVWRLSKGEFRRLKQEFSEAGRVWGKSQYPPFVFSEHGVVMAGTVLSTDEAAAATRRIVDVFVKVRQGLARRTLDGERAVEHTPAATPPALIALGEDLDLSARMGDLFGRIIDALSTEEVGARIEQEVGDIANETVAHIRARLKTVRIRNQKTVAEIQKLLAQADEVQSQSDDRRARMAHVRLALQAKRLRLAAIAQRYLDSGDIDQLISVLDGFDQPKA